MNDESEKEREDKLSKWRQSKLNKDEEWKFRAVKSDKYRGKDITWKMRAKKFNINKIMELRLRVCVNWRNYQL